MAMEISRLVTMFFCVIVGGILNDPQYKLSNGIISVNFGIMGIISIRGFEINDTNSNCLNCFPMEMDISLFKNRISSMTGLIIAYLAHSLMRQTGAI